jgi:hypothetical protein
MKLTNHEWLRAGGWLGLLSIVMGLTGMGLGSAAHAQAVSTTTVQGTVYLANGQPGAGTLVLSWPSFTTGSGQLVAADSTTVTIAPDGFVSVNLAPNLGATPAGQYYTAVYYLSDGTTSTQYWVVPAGAQATLGQVQSQLMPAAQAVQSVSKAYVDQAIASLAGGVLTVTGATMTGALTLCCDPMQPLQAADKHYVDENIALEVPLAGGSMTGPLTSVEIGALYQVDQFSGADFGAKLSECLSGLSQTQGGTCDARNFSGTLLMGSNLTISTANATVQLPCATISTANQVIVTAGTRNVSLRGCALRGASTASGSQGGTVFLYSGTGAMVQVGDPTYAADTMGFHLDNAVINTTSAASATAQGFLAYRAQELDLESLYFLGNSNQTGMTLDGTGNYTGGTFYDDEFIGFQIAVNAIGHQISNPATTDWLNASTFVRLHIDCPTSGGSPISESYGINLQQGDGNTITGGDVEGCSTALHLGANAQNNTIVGLRNENSTNQVVADAGSAYNNWMTGGTMFTGALTDNGTRNSFLDTFHRSFNGLNGDWYGSQKDATVTNHYRIGIGAGNERGLLNRYQTDYGYRWTMGLSDATAGEQFYQILDELNNVYRISIGQYNNGQSSTNNQTVINSAGTGAVVLNGSNNSGTGGVVIGSGGASETTVATINNAGNAQFNGTLQVGGTSTFIGTPTVKNQADAEIDATLWAGLTTSQKESFIYKDWNGNSQWYMVKDASNNWALNSATGGLDSFKAYQSTNSGDTYINASNAAGVVRVNYETGAGTGFNIYGGGSSSLYASFTGTSAIKFPGLAASSGHNCLQIDNSGYITNTGAACGTGGSNGTVNAGTSGQIAYYSGTGTSISGTNTVSIAAGGTGASSASGALANLGGASITGAAFTGPVSAPSVIADTVAAGTSNAVLNAGTSLYPTVASAIAALPSTGGTVTTPPNYTESVATLSIGSATQFVTLLAGKGTIITVTGGTGTAGVQIFNGSDMLCQSSTGEGCSIVSEQTGTPLSLVANGGGSGGQGADDQEYFEVKNWAISCSGSVTYTNGCVDINGVFVPSDMDTVLIYGFSNSIGLHLRSSNVADGGTNVFQCKNCWVNGEGLTGAQPLVIDVSSTGKVSSILWEGGAVENAGNGYHEMVINGNGCGDCMHSLTFVGTQFQGSLTNTTGEVYIVDATNVSFQNPDFNGHLGPSPCIEINQTNPFSTYGIVVENARCSLTTGDPAIKNDIDGYQTASGNYIEPYYVFTQQSAGSRVEPVTIDGNLSVLGTIVSRTVGISTLCSYNTRTSANTGSTTENPILNCAIPAGTMGINSRLEGKFFPIFNGTGNCTLRTRWYTSSGSTSGTAIGQAEISGAGVSGWTEFELYNSGSLTAQNGNYFGDGNAGGWAISGFSSSLNTGTTETYVTVTLQNSVSGDNCYVNSGSVVLWPNG